MKAKTCLALAIAAGCASVASANPEKSTLTNFQSMSADQIGHIYYNMATGEMIRTDSTQNRGVEDSTPVWINTKYDQCDFAEWYYFPIRNSATGEDTWWVDWGDIAENSVIDTMTFLLATSVADPEEDGEDGYEMDVSFFDAFDIGQVNSGAAPYLVYTITGIPGSASGLAAWLITIDVSGGGEFEIGDTDGIDDSGNGFNSGAGADIDAVAGADFGYGFAFRHPGEDLAGVTGSGLVSPPEGVAPNALGTDDVMGLYFGDWGSLDGLYWFGGFDCSGGAGFNWGPWADYYLGLYGPGEGGPDCPPDINNDGAGDGVLDFFDVLQFLAWFSAGDMRADFATDGTLDFFDVLEFLGQFSAGCP